MKSWLVSSLVARGVAVSSLFVVVPACGSPVEGTGNQTETGGASSSSGGTSGDATATTTATATASTTGGGSMTEGMTSAPTTSNGSATTQDPSDSNTGSSGEPSTGGPSTGAESTEGTGSTGGSSGGTTGAIDETTGTSTGEGGSSTTGEPCVPMPEVCNDVDDNCNDVVDDVDVGGDGICDCLNIALFGNKGANPSAEFEVWLEAQGTKVDRIQIDNTPLTQQIVDKYDIIILDRLIRTYTADEAKVMQGWVGDGGGLMAMTGYSGAPPDVLNPNSIIAPMGLSYNNSKGIISGPVTQWNPHPVSEGITSVTFLGGFYIDSKDDGVGQNTVVGTLPAGPVAVAQVRADGKLFIWGDEWIEFDSEWKNIPQIKQLWVNILGWLSPAKFCSLPQ